MLMEWNLRSPISVFGAFGGGELALVARGVLSVFAESSPRSVVGVDEGHTHHPRLLLPPSLPPSLLRMVMRFTTCSIAAAAAAVVLLAGASRAPPQAVAVAVSSGKEKELGHRIQCSTHS